MGALERSARQAPPARGGAPARAQRCHQRWAVAGGDAEGRRGGPQAVALLDEADQPPSAGQSEGGVSVQAIRTLG